MSGAKQWTYVTASCYFKETQSAGVMATVFMGALGEGYWALRLEQEYSLDEGLYLMGSRGFELAGIQPTALRNGGDKGGWYRPSYLYVFKRPEDA